MKIFMKTTRLVLAIMTLFAGHINESNNLNELTTIYMRNSYTNKIVLVIGGTSGIGKATALAFAKAGAKVVITGRREKEGADVAAEITKNGGTAAFVRADVAKEADVVNAIDFVDPPMAVSMWRSTMPASKSRGHSMKSPKNNIAGPSTSTFGAS